MNAKKLLIATAAAIAIAPFAAHAAPGDENSQAWLTSIKSTKTVAEVRAGLDTLPPIGEQHPLDTMATESTRSRAEVKAELAQSGVASFSVFYAGA